MDLISQEMNDFDQKAQEWDKNKMHLERTKAVASQLMKMTEQKMEPQTFIMDLILIT